MNQIRWRDKENWAGTFLHARIVTRTPHSFFVTTFILIMATNLANQLAQLATSSANTLNLKAQKAAHSKSLIFEPRVAAAQTFDTIYTICHEGFQELCLLDGRFLAFQENIFSEQSQEIEREVLTEEENQELDKSLERFLGLVGEKLRLNPAIKAVEWLVRRFRVHQYNTSFVLTTFLPYHTLPIFTTLLSILPTEIPEPYRFLHPYIRSLTQPTRQVVVHAATNNTSFTSVFNMYVLNICKAKQHHHVLLAFWAGIMAEATSGMLDKSRSGRKGVQQQNEEGMILRLLPTLNEGLAMKKIPDLRIGCYVLLTIIASKGGLDDKLLSAMMEAVVLGWTTETIVPGLVCLSVLAQHRGAKQFTKRVTKELFKVPNLTSLLVELSKQRRVDKLTNGLCLALIDRLGKTGDAAGLPIVVQAIEARLLNDSQIVVIIKALLLVAYQIDDSLDTHRDMRFDLASSLVTLTQIAGHTGFVVRRALDDSSVDIDDLEIKLHARIRREDVSAISSVDVDMQDSSTDVSSIPHTFSSLFSQLPTRTANESSFLSHASSHIYQDMCQAFIAASPNTADLNLFDESPILRRDSVLDSTIYLSFYMRTWCGPSPVIARTSALQLANRCLLKNKSSNVDIQAVIPYAIAALGDPATKVRRAAAELLAGIGDFYPTTVDSRKIAKQYRKWAFDDIYGPGEDTRETKWLSLDIVIRFIREMLIPALQECTLDSKHIQSMFEKSLNTPRNSESPKKSETKRLPQTARASILSYLGSHIIHTPVFSLKLRLLQALNHVRSIAGISRTKVLLPVLQQWASLSPSEALDHCINEKIEPREYDEQTLLTIVANDEEGFQFLTCVINGEIATDRPEFIDAVFRRLKAIWPSLKSESRLKISQTLLDSSQRSPGDTKYNEAVSKMSADLLQTVSLSSDIIISFLSQLPTAVKLADKPPATKRRRTSHGEVAKSLVQDSKQLSTAIRKVTFILQLIDSSDPGGHPELMKGLFNTLAELQHFKSQVASELAYLQLLVLSSLLAIMKSHKADPDMKLDRSAVRADLLVDCVQKTASPQVQKASLLLIACLAEIAPEVVLHSVMPVFTFMGSSVLRQNDEYSAHVIDQTIREVIPPLIASLRQEKGDPVTGAAELLLSFVAAYEHVPPHRRGALLTSLVQTLGPEDFLFALLAMLVDKYGPTDNIKTFAAELASAFSVEVQLQSAVKYLDLINDLFKQRPSLSNILLGANEETMRDPYRCALNELMLLPHLLSQKRLVSQTGRLLDRDDMDAARIRDLYSLLLEKLLGLADIVKDHKRMHAACGEVLGSLLGLLSTREFVKSVEGLLDRPNESMRRKILRSLEVRIDQESHADAISRVAILGFLPQLTEIIRESKDVFYKRTAVACVDKISEKYGKKDLEAVSAAAETIASHHCLGQSDNHLRVMALLCLASLVETLREGIVSVLPTAIPKALEYMEESINHDNESQKLHSAGYVFITSLIHHLPYMISGRFLDRLLQISNASAEGGLEDEVDDSRIACLQFAAKQIDAKSLFTALEQDWEMATVAGVLALREYLDILSIAINRHPKSIVTKYSSILSRIFQNAFDLRRRWTMAADNTFTADVMAEIESEVNEVAIKMIYKFNDSTFRPIVSSLVKWASTALPKKDKLGRMLRLQSIYGFMAVFFESLKSIVTNYATYLLENAVDILQNVDLEDEASKELWSRVLRTLTKNFEHDQDDFWQSPLHFGVIAPVLCGQFTLSSSLPLLRDLTPAIVELAAADDSPDHHKELNSAILKHLRSESADVRLAAVQCEQALTDRLGEEWLTLLPEMLPFISELQEDDDDVVEKETHRWIVKMEGILGESLDSMLL